MATARSEFTNESGGFVGVVFIEDGKRRGGSVRPGDSVWLSEEEQIATANAPRRDADNPFTNGFLQLKTAATEIANRRPIGDSGGVAQPAQTEQQAAEAEAAKQRTRQAADAQRQAEAEAQAARAQRQAEQGVRPVPEETGAAVEPQGGPSEGRRAAGEEVGTPKAPAKAG